MSFLARKYQPFIVLSGFVLVFFYFKNTLHNRESPLVRNSPSVHLKRNFENEQQHEDSKQLTTNELVNWKTIDPTKMSAKQITDYLNFANRSSCSLIHDFGGIVYKYGNVVAIDGQKSVCLEQGKAPVPGKCVVYSFGINNEWSFDDTMGKYGCQVFAFDPSMGVKDHDRSANVHFYDIGLGIQDGEKNNGWKVKKLSSIYEILKNDGKHSAEVVIDYT